MSSQESVESVQRVPRELLSCFFGANMELREAQKSCPEALKSLGNDLKIEHLDFHESVQTITTNNIDSTSSEGQLWAHICFEEALKVRAK